MAWILLLGIMLLAWSGWWTGVRIGKSRAWWVGFAIPILVVGLVFVGHRSVAWSFVAPISWTVDAQINPLLMTLAVTIMLATLMVRMPAPRTRVAMNVLMVVMVADYGVLPVALPLAARGTLRATQTQVDAKGVCLQTHTYSCGPAAAVTCIRALGVHAEEGPLAVEAACGPLVGTDGHLLAAAINKLYGGQGIRCAYEPVAALDQLPVPAVANMRMKQIGGHYVAVLAVRPGGVVVGDPLSGEYAMTRPEFLMAWQGAAIVIVATK